MLAYMGGHFQQQHNIALVRHCSVLTENSSPHVEHIVLSPEAVSLAVTPVYVLRPVITESVNNRLKTLLLITEKRPNQSHLDNY
jgi:hypothetical protein